MRRNLTCIKHWAKPCERCARRQPIFQPDRQSFRKRHTCRTWRHSGSSLQSKHVRAGHCLQGKHCRPRRQDRGKRPTPRAAGRKRSLCLTESAGCPQPRERREPRPLWRRRLWRRLPRASRRYCASPCWESLIQPCAEAWARFWRLPAPLRVPSALLGAPRARQRGAPVLSASPPVLPALPPVSPPARQVSVSLQLQPPWGQQQQASVREAVPLPRQLQPR
jgi:hypothetical protein